jgi:hypothetical protein
VLCLAGSRLAWRKRAASLDGVESDDCSLYSDWRAAANRVTPSSICSGVTPE